MQHGLYLKPFYKRSCPFPTRPVKQFRVTIEDADVMFVRDSYNGQWERYDFMQRKTRTKVRRSTLLQAYMNALPLKKAKFNDLQELAKFCSPTTALYFSKLPFVGSDDMDSESSDDSA